MKTVKIILLLAIVSVFTSTPYNAAEARDCSNPKGFHQKLMCKFAADSDDSVTTKEVKKKKKSGSLWQKIKNLGGKNIGESD